jgi:hypothetical protein
VDEAPWPPRLSLVLLQSRSRPRPSRGLWHRARQPPWTELLELVLVTETSFIKVLRSRSDPWVALQGQVREVVLLLAKRAAIP